ncbi:MAG: hypothetical protein KAJ12_11625, partial [Bacteroidetes bacterium]|nr:hypothetical protein [Bacteroidota bacterium]
GKTRFGDYTTDGHALFVVEDAKTIDYVMVNGIRIEYEGRVLHTQYPVLSGLRFDGSPDGKGTGKVRYWREKVEKKQQ